MRATVAIVCYCPRCDYFIKIAVQEDAIGSHGCMGCGGPMEVYIAQGSKEVVTLHRRAEPPSAPAPDTED